MLLHGKAKYTQNCSFVFEGFYTDEKLGLLWGLRSAMREHSSEVFVQRVMDLARPAVHSHCVSC